jgi:hypothetical protein
MSEASADSPDHSSRAVLRIQWDRHQGRHQVFLLLSLEELERLGLQVETAEHAWVHWRSLYVTDPEGNQVELVCYDESV